MHLMIEHQCPQCGAPVVLEETDRLLSCKFCRVKSYLMPRGVFRYLLPSSAPDDQELFWCPYWRFKGLLFSTVPGGVRHRFVDVSQCALSGAMFPVSLGLRSQAMKLRFPNSESPGRFLKPDIPSAAMLETFDSRFGATLPKPIYHQARVGEALSLVYSSFYLKDGKIRDGVLNTAASSASSGADLDDLAWETPRWQTGFLTTLCPDCGWDMTGQRDSLALLCGNCNTVWRPSGDRLKRTAFAHLPPTEDGSIYLPFWRIAADVAGIDLATYADLVKAANLPKVVRNGWRDIPFRFWVPAFKVRPQVFINLGRNMTLCQPQDTLVPTIPEGTLYPVNLPLKEAVESLKTTMAGFLKPPHQLLPRLSEIQVTPKGFLLAWVPFQEGHHEYIHSGFSLAVIKNHLKLSTNL